MLCGSELARSYVLVLGAIEYRISFDILEVIYRKNKNHS